MLTNSVMFLSLTTVGVLGKYMICLVQVAALHVKHFALISQTAHGCHHSPHRAWQRAGAQPWEDLGLRARSSI